MLFAQPLPGGEPVNSAPATANIYDLNVWPPRPGTSCSHLAALRAGRVVRRHVALQRLGGVEVRRVADGRVREVGRRRRRQDGGGRELQGGVRRWAPGGDDCGWRRQRERRRRPRTARRATGASSPLCPTPVRPGWCGCGKVLRRGEESCGEVGLNSGLSGFFMVGEDMSADTGS